MRAASEKVAEVVAGVREASGLELEAEIVFDGIMEDSAALEKAAWVPEGILNFVQELVTDEDYKEAFGDVSMLRFVPAPEDGFDYDSSASLSGGTIEVQFLPLQSMNGGYERSIKGLF
ncbi:MAG: hypothetical protein AAF533_25560 [Acidobacteriota bacterium]